MIIAIERASFLCHGLRSIFLKPIQSFLFVEAHMSLRTSNFTLHGPIGIFNTDLYFSTGSIITLYKALFGALYAHIKSISKSIKRAFAEHYPLEPIPQTWSIDCQTNN